MKVLIETVMNYLIDTNIIIIYSRENDFAKKIEDKYKLFSPENSLYISIVTLGEIDAIIKKNQLGKRKQHKIQRLLAGIYKIGLAHGELISKYGDIDAFSQDKIGNATFSSRNMGKNDLWIAATAANFNLKLLTTDKDFDHLKTTYIDLEFIDLEALTN